MSGLPDLAVLDVETGGLVPETDALLEVCVVRLDPTGSQERGRVVVPVRPVPILRLQAEAVTINRYSAEAWTARDAVEEHVALDAAASLARDACPLGHGVAFDLAFLRAACARQGRSFLPFWRAGRCPLDLMSMAWPYLVRGDAQGRSLDDVARLVGLDPTRFARHSAEGDVDLTIACYRALLRKVGAVAP